MKSRWSTVRGWRQLLLHEHRELRADALDAKIFSATAVDYLTPNLQIKVEFYDGKAVGIELPQTVELDRGGDRAGVEISHGFQRDQAGQD